MHLDDNACCSSQYVRTSRIAWQAWRSHIAIIHQDGRHCLSAKEPISKTLGTRKPFQFGGASNAQTFAMSKARWEKQAVSRLRQNLACGIPHSSTKVCDVLLLLRFSKALLRESETEQLSIIVVILNDVHGRLD